MFSSVFQDKYLLDCPKITKDIKIKTYLWSMKIPWLHWWLSKILIYKYKILKKIAFESEKNFKKYLKILKLYFKSKLEYVLRNCQFKSDEWF
jgi:hypothetical protein